MYRRPYQLIAALLLLSIISGYLLSHSSWVGQTGIRWIHREYLFLNSWWQSSGIVFGLWMLFYGLQSLIQKRASRQVAIGGDLIAIALALAGLYITYSDFRATLSHRWLGERFHLGAYLFWIGWMIISAHLWAGMRKVDRTEV